MQVIPIVIRFLWEAERQQAQSACANCGRGEACSGSKHARCQTEADFMQVKADGHFVYQSVFDECHGLPPHYKLPIHDQLLLDIILAAAQLCIAIMRLPDGRHIGMQPHSFSSQARA